jgi:hypothetical protein
MSEKQRLAASIGAFAAGGIALALLWGWGLRQAGALNAEIETTGAELKSAHKELGELETLERQFRERGGVERRLIRMLPDGRDLERVYEVLEDVERQAGQSRDAIDFTLLEGKVFEAKTSAGRSVVAKPKEYEEVLLELTMSGSWAGFVSFLDGMEHADRLMAVRAFKAIEPDKNNPAFYQYKVVLALYVLKAPEAPKPPPKPEVKAS